MKWKNLKLGRKFFIAFGVIIALFISLTVFSIIGIRTILQNYDAIMVANQLKNDIAQRQIDHLEWAAEVSKFVISDEATELLVEEDPHNCAYGKWHYGEGRKNAEEIVPELKQLFNEIEDTHMQLHASASEIKKVFGQASRVNNNLEYREVKSDQLLSVRNKVKDIYTQITLKNLSLVGKDINNIEELYSKYVQEKEKLIKTESTRTLILIIVLTLIVIIVSISLAYIITRGIVNPISKGVLFTKKISEGDLTATIYIEQKDEIGEMVASLVAMTNKLKQVLIEIISGSNIIVDASQQLSYTSQQLSEGANEQASSIEEVSSTMEQISANIEQNTQNAQQTKKVSTESNNSISEVSEKSRKAVDANKQIAEKITIINDIAFQTNILALNAAVEAARAGDHGKGFAVVAAEVRKLAENSKKAAEEIRKLVQTGLKLSEEAGDTLLNTIPKIENTSKLIEEIAAASIEQNNGANQVNSAIQQLNSVTQQNASSSEELASSAEELARQAEKLMDVISFFNIGINQVKTFTTSNNI